MTTIRCSADTPLSEEEVRATLTDFSARRPEVFPSLDPGLHQVHHRGPASRMPRRPPRWSHQPSGWRWPRRRHRSRPGPARW